MFERKIHKLRYKRDVATYIPCSISVQALRNVHETNPRFLTCLFTPSEAKILRYNFRMLLHACSLMLAYLSCCIIIFEYEIRDSG